MKNLKLFTLLSLSLLSSLSIAAPVGNLVYAPANPPATIPTLSTTMLILMSLLLITVGMYVAKKKNIKGGKLFMTLIGVSTLVAGIAGNNFISNVNAGGSAIPLSNPAGGTVSIFGDTLNEYKNTSGVIQKIISIDLPDVCGGGGEGSQAQAIAANGAPMCTVGMNVALDGMCEIDCATTISVF